MLLLYGGICTRCFIDKRIPFNFHAWFLNAAEIVRVELNVAFPWPIYIKFVRLFFLKEMLYCIQHNLFKLIHGLALVVSLHNYLVDFILEPISGIPDVILLNLEEQVRANLLHLKKWSFEHAEAQWLQFLVKVGYLWNEVAHPRVTFAHEISPTFLLHDNHLLWNMQRLTHEWRKELYLARDMILIKIFIVSHWLLLSLHSIPFFFAELKEALLIRLNAAL